MHTNDTINNNSAETVLESVNGIILDPHPDIRALQQHVNDSIFVRLSSRCSNGDVDAFFEMSMYFKSLIGDDDDTIFYTYAYNYWLYKSCVNGNKSASKQLATWILDHPDTKLPTILPEESDDPKYSLEYSVEGSLMKSLGFTFFDSKRGYELKLLKCPERMYEVNSSCDYDSPDSDGFGIV